MLAISLKKTTVIFLILLFAIVVFVLFPRKNTLKDGGTVIYESFGFGAFYQIENRHRLYYEANNLYYEKGTVISLFGIEVFNTAEIDYDHPFEDGVPYADVEINSEIESFLS